MGIRSLWYRQGCNKDWIRLCVPRHQAEGLHSVQKSRNMKVGRLPRYLLQEHLGLDSTGTVDQQPKGFEPVRIRTW
jgi:hypothetical protein